LRRGGGGGGATAEAVARPDDRDGGGFFADRNGAGTDPGEAGVEIDGVDPVPDAVAGKGRAGGLPDPAEMVDLLSGVVSGGGEV